MYHPNPYKFAREIAKALDDMDAVSLHESFAKRIHEHVLNRLLKRVLSVPDRKIMTSRAALFTFLVKQYENEKNKIGNTRDFARHGDHCVCGDCVSSD